MTDSDHTLVGALLDHRYLVTGLLARGGMSTVYRGMDTRLERPVAIKVMHQQYAADRKWAQRFHNEALAAAKLHHLNVVGVYDQGIDHRGDEAHAFLVMELVDGGTLRDLLEAHATLEPALAIAITEQVLAALAAAHRAGLVHRDVKPENVLIGHGAGPRDDPDSGAVKVADFGLVRAIAAAGTTSSSVILGTVAYLSPEQVETGDASERSDLYSTGLLLYEMLTGKPAFSGDTALSVAYQHVNSDVPAPRTINPDVPEALSDLVVRATRRDPDLRPRDAATFLEELRQARTDAGLPQVTVPAVPAPDSDRPAPDDTVPVMAPIETEYQDPMPPTGAPPRRTLTTSMSPVRNANWRRIGLWAAVVVLISALIGVGISVFSGGTETVTMPSLQARTKTAAEEELRKLGLNPTIVEERHDTIAAGVVISTDPPPQTQLDKGDKVTVTVSVGRPVVPDVTEGATVQEAQDAIKSMQLKPVVDAENDIYHTTVPQGAVVRVQPEPGTQLDIGEDVEIVLSKGPPPTPVPDVSGMPKEEAFNKIREVGYNPVDGGEQFNRDVPAGHVIRTEPAANEHPETGDVRVIVSNAVPVPGIIGRRLKEARRIVAEAGLKLAVREGRGGPNTFVIAQDPGPSRRIEPGGTIHVRTIP